MAATGVPEVIPTDDNAGAPNGPYASLETNQIVTQRGQSAIKTVKAENGLVTKAVVTNIVSECSIQFYRGDASSYANKLRDAHKRPSISMALMRAGIGWGAVGPVNNLTALQGSQEEQRRQVSVSVMFTEIITDEVDAIEFVEVFVDNDKGDQVVDFEVDTREPLIPDYVTTFDGLPLAFSGDFLTFTP